MHQQLWSYDLKRRTRAKSSMARLAIFCSEREENNDNAYFTACDRLKLRYLQELQERDPETLHEGVVVRTTAAGLVVDLPKLGIFGFVPRPRFAPAAFRRGRGEDALERADCGRVLARV